MKILMVYPEYPDTFWSFKHALKFIRKNASLPPLGLLTVAALLPIEWEKKLIDLNFEKLTPDDILWADYVFISAMSIQKESVKKIIKDCKKHGAKIVAGGPLFTLEETERYEEIDHFVLNEAEITLPTFLADLAKGEPKKTYETNKYCDMKKSVMPLFKLAKIKHYASIGLQLSRGCPFDCEFCDISAIFGKNYRNKETYQVIRELDEIYKTGWRGPIFIVDDNFIGKKKELKNTILPDMINWRKDKTGIPFNTQVSLNLADDDELMGLMRQAGFVGVFIGIESPNEESLIECNKQQNTKGNIIDNIKKIQSHGLQVQGGFIVGFDHDTTAIFNKQIELIQQSGIVVAMVGLLQAPAKTRLHEKLKKENRIIGGMTGDNGDGSTNIIPKLMDIETLREGYKKIIKEIYSPKMYYERIKTLCKFYKPPVINTHIDFEYVMAIPRSMWQLGIKSAERFYYWKLITWTLLTRPRAIPFAITQAIYCRHFYIIANQIT